MKIGTLVRWERRPGMGDNAWDYFSKKCGVITDAPKEKLYVVEVLVRWIGTNHSGWVNAAHLEVVR